MRVGKWGHTMIGLWSAGYSVSFLHDGLALAVPVLYWVAVYYYKPAVRWFYERRALRKYRRDLNAENPLAELETMR